MKIMIKTLAIGLAIIMIFSTALLAGAYALSTAPVEGKTVSGDDFMDDSLFVRLNDVPVPQSDLQKKFAVYNNETVKEEDKILTYFTEEQAEQLKARKDSGEMFTLTYDEILFIISDSIQAYFNYDTIIHTNAIRYGLTTKLYLSCNAQTVVCYHGDFSELEYSAAIQKYDEMIAGIYDIIVYRISMLDAGFLSGIYNMTDDGEPLLSITAGQFIKSFDNTEKDDYRTFLASELVNYHKKIEASLSGYYKPEELAIELKAPLLLANYISSANGKMIYTVETDCLTETVLFPTVELLAMRPDTKKEDSVVISDDIKMNLGALEAYQEKDGERAFKEAENVKSVFRIYNTSLHIAFSKYSNITSLLESEDILQTIYVVQYKDGTFRAFNDDNSYTELLSNRFVYDDTGEKIVLPPVDISEQALAALQTNDIVSKAAKDMKVLHKYYLYGEPSMSGNAVYYETDKGDYVYYYHYSIGEYLFPVAEFCAFQKAIVAEINKNPNADGGVVLSGIWDLSEYDFNSSTFDLKPPQ